MWDFEHDPLQRPLAEKYDIQQMLPSQCAGRLATADADIGLVPIAAYANISDLRIIPGCAIASKGAIRSLLLVHRALGGRETIRTVAADTSSQATFAYVQVLFKKFWHLPVSFAPLPANLDAMLAACDAAILIGDPALMALEDRAAREQRTGEKLIYLDLGVAWYEATGMPWVSAFWAVRDSSVSSAELRNEVRSDFLASRDHGLLHREELVQEWAQKIALPAQTIRDYLTTNIHYILDDECLAAIEYFFRVAHESSILPAAPPLRLL